MAYLVASLMAAASFIVNRALFQRFGSHIVISLSPVVEEAAKTLSAYYFRADLITVHAVFGVIEATYDWYYSRGKAFKAAALSITGHTLFGLVTGFSWQVSGTVWLGLAAGSTFHLLWNVVMLRLFTAK